MMRPTWLAKACTILKASNPHEWIKSLAIIAAGVWTIFTFTPRTPSLPDVSLSISQKPEATITSSMQKNANSLMYSRLELSAKFTNPSSRTLWLGAPLIVASGIMIGKRKNRAITSPNSDTMFIPRRENKLTNSINYYESTYEPYMLRTLNLSSIPPGSSQSISIILPTPKDRYQGVEILLIVPQSRNRIERFDTMFSVNEGGRPAFAICSTQKDNKDCTMISAKEMAEARLEIATQRIQAWLQ